MPDACRVFVSYTRADRARVAPIVDLLRGAGFDVWWDSDLKSGVAFARETEAALEAADVVVVAWSAGSVQSDWVRDEADHGRDRGRLLPLRLDDVQVPLGFRQVQWVDLIGWKGSAEAPEARRLVAAVAGLAGQPAPSRVAAPAPPAPGRTVAPSRRALLAGGAVAAIGIGAIAAVRLSPDLGCRLGLGDCAVATTGQSLAVLPFANLSAAPDQAYFADGLTEELQTRLGRFPGLAVAGRTSSFRFKDRRQSPAEMAAALGVGFLLDGSVRRAGDRVRVSAQLIDASTGLQRWNETYERQLKDIFAVQSEIADAVAGALRVKLLGQRGVAEPGGTADPAAWEQLLRGRAMLSAVAGEAGLRQALAHFDAAIAADPRFARAHAARARALIGLANQFLPVAARPAAYADALASARLAVRIAPDVADTQTSLALALVEGEHDFLAAGQAFDRALAAGPPDAGTLYRHGVFLLRTGRLPEALRALQVAAQRDPLNATSWKSYAQALITAGRFDAAVAAGRRALMASPEMSGGQAMVGKALYFKGDLRQALAAYRLEPEGWERLTGEAIVLHRLGDQQGAATALAELVRRDGDAIWYQRAQIAAQWGQIDAALAALTAALRNGDAGLNDILLDRFVQPLASRPQFKKIVADLGLDPPGRST